ncbi:Hypothetical protein F387_01451 [Wohlfahrtiimonas chitiniclastica SH04]|uniref:Glycosyltransferase n=1 Tax=Wohlfahrtiimonas chitiniclastica SH04 TaxID=1261130 RepID=L8XUR2_9GAMM|nr:hypothetical protein [Wohlfahrtiimonas chitiniclastica]ELV07647.1 Hypothetical protein F387_01451 [Wohlfahrtiimonas chitiniclastica SH04]
MKHLQADITIDIVAFGMQYIDENGLVLGQTMPNIEGYYQQRDILLLNGSIDTSMCTKVYETQLFFEHRFIDGMIYEDQEILPKILYGKKVVQIPYYLYNYVIHVGSTMRRYNESYLESFILLFNRHKDFLLKIKAFDELSVYYEKGYILNFYINSITYIGIYSPDFSKDVKRLDDLMDKKIINLFNIIKLLPIKSMKFIGILIFKISPIAFKYLYKKIKG